MGSKVSSLKEKISSVTGSREKKKKDGRLRIISRAEWKARVPQWREDLIYPALSSALTYTGTETCNSKEECTLVVQNLQNKHMDQDGLPDIEFSFLVGGDGSVFEGRGWHTISNRNHTIHCVDPENPPQHTVLNIKEQRGSPDRQIVIAFIGNEHEQEATEVMMHAATRLVQFGINSYYLEGQMTELDDEDGKLEKAYREVLEANKNKD